MTEKSKARLPLGKRAFVGFCGLVAVALAGLILWLWQDRNAEYQLDAFAMGSYIRQTVWGTGREKAAQAANTAINQLENQISWRRGGDVAAINENAGKAPAKVDEKTGALLEEILRLCQRSGGALDITLGPVTRLWDFDNDPHLPDKNELEAALELVGVRKLSMDREEYMYAVPNEDGSHTDSLGVRYYASLAEPGMTLDLGAIGKGAACDAAIEVYRQEGASAAVIAVGGSVGLYGEKPGGKPWSVSVWDPAGAGSLGVLELPGGFVSTSGSYEKFFEENGKTYCHLLDPRTGYPAESGLVSVTVWCPPEMDADFPGALSDGLATACFVLGLEDSASLLEEYGAQALFVDENGQVYATDGLAERFRLTAPGYRLADW